MCNYESIDIHHVLEIINDLKLKEFKRFPYSGQRFLHSNNFRDYFDIGNLFSFDMISCHDSQILLEIYISENVDMNIK